jgi:hypothetical protein
MIRLASIAPSLPAEEAEATCDVPSAVEGSRAGAAGDVRARKALVRRLGREIGGRRMGVLPNDVLIHGEQ